MAFVLSVAERARANIGWRNFLHRDFRTRPERIKRVCADLFGATPDEICGARFVDAIGVVWRTICVEPRRD
jgi:hypothetical protein